MSPRKNNFPPERDTQPDLRRPTARAVPKSKREPPAATTARPPKSKRGKPSDTKSSAIRSRRPPAKRGDGATVDEVVADMSKDPRRERDD